MRRSSATRLCTARLYPATGAANDQQSTIHLPPMHKEVAGGLYKATTTAPYVYGASKKSTYLIPEYASRPC